jgi:hypothetical protein
MRRLRPLATYTRRVLSDSHFRTSHIPYPQQASSIDHETTTRHLIHQAYIDCIRLGTALYSWPQVTVITSRMSHEAAQSQEEALSMSSSSSQANPPSHQDAQTSQPATLLRSVLSSLSLSSPSSLTPATLAHRLGVTFNLDDTDGLVFDAGGSVQDIPFDGRGDDGEDVVYGLSVEGELYRIRASELKNALTRRLGHGQGKEEKGSDGEQEKDAYATAERNGRFVIQINREDEDGDAASHFQVDDPDEEDWSWDEDPRDDETIRPPCQAGRYAMAEEHDTDTIQADYERDQAGSRATKPSSYYSELYTVEEETETDTDESRALTEYARNRQEGVELLVDDLWRLFEQHGVKASRMLDPGSTI